MGGFSHFEKRVKCVPSLPHVIESKFIPNRAVEVRQLAKGKGKGKYFACRKEKGLFKGYNPQTCSKLFIDFEDAAIAAKKNVMIGKCEGCNAKQKTKTAK